MVFLTVARAAPVAQDPSGGNTGSASGRPKIGLVLSGGGALGLAHVGVLRVLEELRVPIDVVAGTSMGSIVGASYASGMSPGEMARRLEATRWDDVFRDTPPRTEQSVLRKQLDALGLWGFELGVSRGLPFLPKGAIAGQQLLRTLRSFVREPPGGDFDRLAVPFRAVATNIETGEMVVLSRGDLARAMRASMSVPGVIAPEEIGGQMLLDGGLVRNLPVDVARAMGADIVIAVNLGTKLLKRDDLQSVVGVSLQMINILTEQNVRQSLAELTDRDILIEPELEGFSAIDFNRSGDIVPRGEAAARRVLERLRALSLPESDYAAYRAAQVAHMRDRPPVVGMRVETAGLRYVNPAAVEAALRTESGAVPSDDDVARQVGRLYGRGDLDRIDYRFVEAEGGRVLAIETREKPRGPDYLRLGLSLSSDFRGDGRFSLRAFYDRTWLNALGAEWRNWAQVGYNPGITSEWYQPLDLRGWLFVAPRIEVSERVWDLFLGDDRIAQYIVRQAGVGLDVGANFEKWGELRVGVYRARASAHPNVAIPLFPDVDVQVGNFRVKGLYDQLDNVNFPTAGNHLSASLVSSARILGASSRYSSGQVEATQAFGRGPHGVVFTLRGGRALSGDVPVYDQFTLGGFLNLSGYQLGQLTGDSFVLGRAVYHYRLRRVPALAEGLFWGFSLETGNVYQRLDGASSTGLKAAGSVFVAADTAIGPAYLAVGRSVAGLSAVYLFLGRP